HDTAITHIYTLSLHDALPISNVHSNDSVKAARKGIARHLTQSGAKVKFVDLPADCGQNGVDDLLAAWGPARVLKLFEQAVSGGRDRKSTRLNSSHSQISYAVF